MAYIIVVITNFDGNSNTHHFMIYITDPQDYQPLNTSRMITGSSRFFQITTVEDKVDEDPETFSLRLELAEDNNLIPLSLVDQAVVTILDDDGVYLCTRLSVAVCGLLLHVD